MEQAAISSVRRAVLDASNQPIFMRFQRPLLEKR
jgi:hypothetical protein